MVAVENNVNDRQTVKSNKSRIIMKKPSLLFRKWRCTGTTYLGSTVLRSRVAADANGVHPIRDDSAPFGSRSAALGGKRESLNVSLNHSRARTAS